MPAGNSHMRLRSVPKGPSWCQPKQMVEGLCYINERSPRHWRYLSSWQFTSLLRTYQSCPIIFIELSCHLHCQKHSFFNILKARPTSAGVRLWHSNPSGKMVAGPSVAMALLQTRISCTSTVSKQKPSGMRKKNIKAGLSFAHFHTQIHLFIPNGISVTILHTSVCLLCLQGCKVTHPLEGSANCQVAGINKQGSCSAGVFTGHYLQKHKRANDRYNNRM